MKEVTKYTSVEFAVTNSTTGESLNVAGKNVEKSTYYTIKKITARVNAMELLTVIEATCTSPKDVKILNYLLDNANAEGKVIIDNISEEAKKLEIARSKLNNILKKCENENFFRKLDRGSYLINPFIFIGRRVRSNKIREKLQKDWLNLINTVAREGKSNERHF